jgi:hypothetical protein
MHILLPWAFGILIAVVWLYIKFYICLTIIIAVICIIEVAIPVMVIICWRNASTSNVIITFDWLTVDSFDLVDIE